MRWSILKSLSFLTTALLGSRNTVMSVWCCTFYYSYRRTERLTQCFSIKFNKKIFYSPPWRGWGCNDAQSQWRQSQLCSSYYIGWGLCHKAADKCGNDWAFHIMPHCPTRDELWSSNLMKQNRMPSKEKCALGDKTKCPQTVSWHNDRISGSHRTCWGACSKLKGYILDVKTNFKHYKALHTSSD